MVEKGKLEYLKKTLIECEKAVKVAELTLRLYKAFLESVEREEASKNEKD